MTATVASDTQDDSRLCRKSSGQDCTDVAATLAVIVFLVLMPARASVGGAEGCALRCCWIAWEVEKKKEKIKRTNRRKNGLFVFFFFFLLVLIALGGWGGTANRALKSKKMRVQLYFFRVFNPPSYFCQKIIICWYRGKSHMAIQSQLHPRGVSAERSATMQ